MHGESPRCIPEKRLRRPVVGRRHGPVRHLCAWHHRDVGDAERRSSASYVVACEKERHTAENITKWTKEALEAIGLKAEGPEGLLGQEAEGEDGH